jgi:hypothetical protein
MRKARKIKLSFVAVVLIAFAVLAVMGWQINKTHGLSSQNRELIQNQRATATVLCANQNYVLTTLAGLVSQAEDGWRSRGRTDIADKFHRTAAELRSRKC